MNKDFFYIDNFKNLLIFRGFLLFILTLGASPLLFVSGDKNLFYVTLISSVILICILWIVLKPSFIALEINNEDIFIYSEKEKNNNFILQKKDLYKIEIHQNKFQLTYSVKLFRSSPKGIFVSKPFSLNLFSPKKIKLISDVLQNIANKNHTGHIQKL